ncbi:fluoride efflux transporter CrcB [Cryobacterium sp. HLT2-28]|uniref:fluoride efflux transporter CrcB n=1 Tax=Cryobacterium sp. HLT2-28 TaxID=1259146 RepID=UPI0010691E25|nr:fluoride efflux transporter CrcB [Cryobacterium sp. HLT2-28]TFB91653.1 fluoride efflux transporter CrcB [Cryobacterium sp. HLT2-28]
MNILTVLAAALAGGIGAAARVFVDGTVRTRWPAPTFPAGLVLINVTGSLGLGLVTGLALEGLVSPEWQVILGGGLLGGYTTFSTASVDTAMLLRKGRPVAAVATGLGMLLGSVAAAGLGLWVGLQL